MKVANIMIVPGIDRDQLLIILVNGMDEVVDVNAGNVPQRPQLWCAATWRRCHWH